MKRTWPLIVALAIGSTGVSAQGNKSRPQYVITDVQAKLYYSNSGRFSANIVNNRKIALWNVIIGEGGVEGPSTTTLIEVRVSGAPESFPEKLKLRVKASTSKSVLLDRQAGVGPMNTNGHHYAAFLVHDTGCEPLEIVAELTGPGAGPPAKGTIPFRCGE